MGYGLPLLSVFFLFAWIGLYFSRKTVRCLLTNLGSMNAQFTQTNLLYSDSFSFSFSPQLGLMRALTLFYSSKINSYFYPHRVFFALEKKRWDMFSPFGGSLPFYQNVLFVGSLIHISKFYFTKIFFKNSFWAHLPSSMFWQCILSPQKISNF